MNKNFTIDNSWTLFLDRDGVLNHEINGDYVRTPEQFVFYDGVLKAMEIFKKKFKTIVIVTNQRGIGKGLMTENDLSSIHKKMLNEIETAGGKIDSIFYCTDVETESPNRKPNPGMALQAKEKFKYIDFEKSIMVGNKLSDMKFGRNAGMQTVFIASTNPDTEFPNALIDARFGSLYDFALAIK